VYDKHMKSHGATKPGEPAGPFVNVAWPKHSGKILCHHGLNLGWIGLWALAMPVWLYTSTRTAAVFGLVPYLADWGYFVTQDAFDLCEVPGQMQTFIVSVALGCTSLAVMAEYDVPRWEQVATLFLPAWLFGSAVLVRGASALTSKASGDTKKAT